MLNRFSSNRALWLALSIVAACVLQSAAQEHRVEPIKEAPEADGLAEEVAARIADGGFQVLRGSSRTVCEIWPCKHWESVDDFKPNSERLYPFKPGQLFGLLHFKRRGKDFRDQTINRGWYTLRYGLQPTDGNHEGTSPTRDFLLMVRAEDDTSPKPMPMKKLLEVSAEAAGTSHPAMVCLQRVAGKDALTKPSVRHLEEQDWWVLQFSGKTQADGKDEVKNLPVAMVVAGHAEE